MNEYSTTQIVVKCDTYETDEKLNEFLEELELKTQQTWEASLGYMFPGRKFEVEVKYVG